MGTIAKPKLETGMLLLTDSINSLMLNDRAFYADLLTAIDRYKAYDWGELAPEDKQSNDQALFSGDRILAAYPTCAGTIWIITEADRSATTILFPSEY